jgi:mannosylglycerate hydrolase
MENKTYTLHLVSHTHWDREWYQTFQQFRLRLVHLTDHMLNLLAVDPNFKYFMLDGQTIVLDDYLEIRPDKRNELENYIKSGRILIGPWYILPDEFLVSPEATTRNLIIGDRICKAFGGKMPVGYIPDPFGHIGQMPQILRGFGIESACLWRGLSDEPCEFWWSAPDGSKVFMSYLRENYGNGAGLNTEQKDIFVEDILRARDALAPHSNSSHLLIMHGTDHMEPQSDTSAAISSFNQSGVNPATHLLHSTLPQYLSAVQVDINQRGIEIPTRTGELRDCQRAPLLPGVLSTRMWIKQRNHTCQNLLEKWAEPFSAWASVVVEDIQPSDAKPLFPSNRIIHPEQVLQTAWRLLIQCHPHDSICGCSIDQVHEEMRPRFDQVEQIGEDITSQSLATLVEAIDTTPIPSVKSVGAVTVFNPTSGPRTGLVTTDLQLPEEVVDFEIIDVDKRVMPHQLLSSSSKPFVNMTLSSSDFKPILGMISGGRAINMVISNFAIHREESNVIINFTFSETGEPALEQIKAGTQILKEFVENPSISHFILRGILAATTKITFLAQDVPGYGYRTFWVQALSGKQNQPQTVKLGFLARTVLPLASRIPFLQKLASGPNKITYAKPPYRIENEIFQVEAKPSDGTLTILDKRTGQVFHGQNCFVDGGDCGDEYNYSPPEKDQVIRGTSLIHARVEESPVKQAIHLDLEMKLPQSLSQDRKSRGEKTITLPIHTSISLISGVARVEIHTEVENLAQDHRLRVHFPAPFRAQVVDRDGHFEIVHRLPSPTPDGNLPYPEPSWSEQPRTEMPQQAFSDISNGKDSLLIANRGLPEVAVLPTANDCHEIALTLLRCVGWLSREDLSTRKGHAGPDMPTPAAQMPGNNAFDYAILPHSASETVKAYHEAYAFNAAFRSARTSLHFGPLPASGSMVEVTHPEFVLSAVKIAEDGSGLVVRGYNISNQSLTVTIKPWKKFFKASQVNLLEAEQASLSTGEQGEVSFQVAAFQIVSIKFS